MQTKCITKGTKNRLKMIALSILDMVQNILNNITQLLGWVLDENLSGQKKMKTEKIIKGNLTYRIEVWLLL